MRSMKFVLWALLAVLLTAISVSSALAAPALRLSPGQERYGLGGYMEVLEDPTNSLTVEEVASGENGRNRLRLDRRGNGVTLFGDRTQKRFGQPE